LAPQVRAAPGRLGWGHIFQWVWWHMPIIAAFRRQRQEDCDYIARPCLKRKKEKSQKQAYALTSYIQNTVKNLLCCFFFWFDDGLGFFLFLVFLSLWDNEIFTDEII
jgi:hypothetical protein